MPLLITGAKGFRNGDVFSVRWTCRARHDNNTAPTCLGQTTIRAGTRAAARLVVHHELDIRDWSAVTALMDELRRDPAHGRATQSPARIRPFDAFDVNAVGTHSKLHGSVRRYCGSKAYGQCETRTSLNSGFLCRWISQKFAV